MHVHLKSYIFNPPYYLSTLHSHIQNNRNVSYMGINSCRVHSGCESSIRPFSYTYPIQGAGRLEPIPAGNQDECFHFFGKTGVTQKIIICD